MEGSVLGKLSQAVMDAAVEELKQRYPNIDERSIIEGYTATVRADKDPGGFIVYFNGAYPLTLCVQLEDVRHSKLQTQSEFEVETGYRIVGVTAVARAHRGML